MKTNVAYMADNAEGLVWRSGMPFYKKTLDRIRSGTIDSLTTLENVTSSNGRGIGEMFVKPGEDASPWADSSSSYLPATLSAYLDALDMPTKDLTDLLSNPKLNIWAYRHGKYLPSLETTQELAFILDVEVSDLFLPPKSSNIAKLKDMRDEIARNSPKSPKCAISNQQVIDDGRITSFECARDNFRYAAEVAGYVLPSKVLTDNTRITVVEKYAKKCGTTIGDIFVKPGVETEWYRETSAHNFPYMLENVWKESGKTGDEVAKATKMHKNVFLGLVYGEKVATLRQVYKLATYFDVEIGDLFMVPDGLKP